VEPDIEFDQIPRAQRMRRIAELLCKAIVLTEAGRPRTDDASRSVPEVPAAPPVSGDGPLGDDRIVNYLDFVGTASPAVIRTGLGLTRTSVHRALRRLSAAGVIVGSGQTRRVVYRLSQGEPPPDQIGLN
jgi:biotin operon repressor